jgi:hypothetical protein
MLLPRGRSSRHGRMHSVAARACCRIMRADEASMPRLSDKVDLCATTALDARVVRVL